MQIQKPLKLAIALVALTITTSVATAQSKSKMQDKKVAMAAKESRAYLNNNNIPSSGLALEGYCPVAYFAVNKPLKGDPKFAVDYKGVIYHFVSADAKAAFMKTPDKFVPAYGGWCALGMAVGDKFPVDPTNFKIVDGKLNLFLRNKNVDALELWNKGEEKDYVAKADAYWGEVNK